MIKIINFITGFLIGALIVFGIFFSHSQTEHKTDKNNVSLEVPKQLPKDEIEFIEVKVPQNLKEVIL